LRLISSLSTLFRERSCFLFDLDGTLVDSNGCHERAYLEALERLLPDLAKRFSYEACKGRKTRDALRMFGVEDEPLLTQVTDAKQSAYRALVEAGAVPLLPHAQDLLQTLRASGKRLFIVTGSSARSTRAVLTSLGIFDWFEHIVTADDIISGKPAPDCWLTCLERASIQPAQALAIEDALSGVLAARAAGIDCLAVNNPNLAGIPEYAEDLRNLLVTARA
jgi:beta-phosphoglucomutase